MEKKTLRDVAELAGSLQPLFIATADKRGMPHIATAGKIRVVSEDQVGVEAWFCPGTLENLEKNKNISIVVWDRPTDQGYQLLGFVESLEDIAIMDGYIPENREAVSMPQAEIRLLARVTRVMEFSNAPHNDTEAE